MEDLYIQMEISKKRKTVIYSIQYHKYNLLVSSKLLICVFTVESVRQSKKKCFYSNYDEGNPVKRHDLLAIDCQRCGEDLWQVFLCGIPRTLFSILHGWTHADLFRS